ncbi:SAUR-like auxin-responsive protein family [Zostera marina]|uniref:SAUR-like auxin-responsive protein family n=1 Tax=Zostera marina TaxID=29655 RepID=A0A0K9PIJ0_ZOSMR|nr:SAUR-like auxin-responsive protein family [Zostera marina]
MGKMNGILKKCKSLSKLARSLSFSSLKPTTEGEEEKKEEVVMVFVGSSRRSYNINAKHLTHPLMNTLLEKKHANNGDNYITVRCEVVLFDHLLWMLENVDLDVISDGGSLEELANLYAY